VMGNVIPVPRIGFLTFHGTHFPEKALKVTVDFPTNHQDMVTASLRLVWISSNLPLLKVFFLRKDNNGEK